jgi:hypothetical protein
MEGRTNKKKKTQKQGSTGLRKKECKELKASLFFLVKRVFGKTNFYVNSLYFIFLCFDI